MKKELLLAILGALMLAGGYYLGDKGLRSASPTEIADLEATCHDGQQVLAVVDPNYETRTTKPSKNSYPTHSFILTYRYDAGGQKYDGTVTVDSLPASMTLPLWYAKSNPKQHVLEEPCPRLAAAQSTAAPSWYVYLGIPLGLVGFFLLYRNVKRFLRPKVPGAD